MLRSWLEKLYQQCTSRGTPFRRSRTKRPVSVVSRVERLESRELLSASAQAGDEFRVNTTTAGNQQTDQFSPGAVAMDSVGNYVVVWTSTGQDGSGNGIYAQRYNAGGIPQGGEFLVNTTTASDQQNATVAMDASGNFVVTWESLNQDGSNFGIFAQRYNAAGVAQGVEFQVNTDASNAQRLPTVAMADNGNFVIVWSTADGSSLGVHAQRYDAAGVAQGSEFLVNTSQTLNAQQFATVAMDATGNFVVTWTDVFMDGRGDIFAQRYDSTGAAQGSAFLVSSTTGFQTNSAIAMNASGEFVITWQHNGNLSGNTYEIMARRYDAAGVAQGSQFQVNTTTTNDQTTPSVAMDDTGAFTVTWVSLGSDKDIFAQTYSDTGVAQGTEFRVNTATLNGQQQPTIAMDADGDYVVVWTSVGQDAGGAGLGVYGQRYSQTLRLAGTSLLITGQNVADNITVSLLNPTTLEVNYNGVNTEFALASVTDIQITGQNGNDALTITSDVLLAASINGGVGNDNLTAGGGNTTLTGGTGDDTYHFGNSAANKVDTVVELAAGGTDTLNFGTMSDAVTVNLTSDAALATMTNRTMQTGGAGQAANFENVTGGSGNDSITGNAVDNVLTGLGGTDTLIGNNGSDTLTGGANNDSLDGGIGNDNYLFNTTVALGTDSITDSSGVDTLNFTGSTNNLTVNLSLTTTQVVNGNLSLTLASATSMDNITAGTGIDTLTGNTINNVLVGGGGNDTMSGLSGDDQLFGQAGNDSMAGGGGNDTYFFSNPFSAETDTVTELASQGTDTLNFDDMTTNVTVILSTDKAMGSMTNRRINSGGAGQSLNFENIVGGSSRDVLVGNAANNVITGNDGNDVLDGGDGNDTLNGGNGADNLTGGKGDDTLNGDTSGDTLSGGDGNDTLTGGDGSDIATGGLGNDIYTFANAIGLETDTVTEQAGQGVDTLNFTTASADITAIMTTDAALVTMTNRTVQTGDGQAENFENVTGGSGDDILIGNSGNNLLTGGSGDDVLTGGDGNDTYSFNTIFAQGSDDIGDSAGIDTVSFAAASNNLTLNIGLTTAQVVNANLTLTIDSATSMENIVGGSGNDILIGNTLANNISGGAGNDVITGGAGNDTLSGGTGANILIGGAGADSLTGGANDDLLLAATYQFEQNVTSLTALRAEWSSVSSYSDRLAHLQGTLAGGANGSTTLTKATVTDDGVNDSLTGGGGRDWFIGTSLAADTVTDQAVDEVFTQISALP